MKTVTVQGVECVQVEVYANAKVVQDYVSDNTNGRRDTGCLLCPQYGRAGNHEVSCESCRSYYIPMQHVPVLIMRGLKV